MVTPIGSTTIGNGQEPEPSDVELAQAIADLSATTHLSAAQVADALGLGRIMRERDQLRAELAEAREDAHAAWVKLADRLRPLGLPGVTAATVADRACRWIETLREQADLQASIIAQYGHDLAVVKAELAKERDEAEKAVDLLAASVRERVAERDAAREDAHRTAAERDEYRRDLEVADEERQDAVSGLIALRAAVTAIAEELEARPPLAAVFAAVRLRTALGGPTSDQEAGRG